jgi:hypothetical protein
VKFLQGKNYLRFLRYKVLMQINDIVLRKGFITQDKFLLGQTLIDLEKRLGYKTGRFLKGIWVGVCLKLPGQAQFDVKGYSQVAGHKEMNLEGVEVDQVRKIALSRMRTDGPDRVVKVFPAIGHDTNLTNDEQYPPGLGIPQWDLTTPLPFRIISFVSDYPMGRYKLI